MTIYFDTIPILLQALNHMRLLQSWKTFWLSISNPALIVSNVDTPPFMVVGLKWKGGVAYSPIFTLFPLGLDLYNRIRAYYSRLPWHSSTADINLTLHPSIFFHSSVRNSVFNPAVKEMETYFRMLSIERCYGDSTERDGICHVAHDRYLCHTAWGRCW